MKKEELRDDEGNKLTTVEYSYWLYKQGYTIAQIAEKRGLNPVTIEGHLARYVASGDIDVLWGFLGEDRSIPRRTSG